MQFFLRVGVLAGIPGIAVFLYGHRVLVAHVAGAGTAKEFLDVRFFGVGIVLEVGLERVAIVAGAIPYAPIFDILAVKNSQVAHRESLPIDSEIILVVAGLRQILLVLC